MLQETTVKAQLKCTILDASLNLPVPFVLFLKGNALCSKNYGRLIYPLSPTYILTRPHVLPRKDTLQHSTILRPEAIKQEDTRSDICGQQHMLLFRLKMC